ncbi:hypothetical protein HMPREF9057_01472 [Actinomyces sp. oral taxon 171 str. F0337]|nr:hypothetical protein HMPREF9057_01472 [Actinomyces sp. oral taxon 171 str. F0337]
MDGVLPTAVDMGRPWLWMTCEEVVDDAIGHSGHSRPHSFDRQEGQT